MDYDHIMSVAVKAGPLLMKINIFKWKSVMVAIAVKSFIF
jgi:hypothetical protein